MGGVRNREMKGEAKSGEANEIIHRGFGAIEQVLDFRDILSRGVNRGQLGGHGFDRPLGIENFTDTDAD